MECALHLASIIASSRASEWTLAHQIGHVLSLTHADGTERLMTGRRTDTIEAEIADDVVPGLAASFEVHVSPLGLGQTARQLIGCF
ncbi:hypothetical protein [Azohydromonas lata]|uniref:Peptidase M10 metallopeptidase domain-containing protein n=1 Tax=Azohydromonas lata TaxID=45677 RepID=A0ABU5I7K8_9BURK|nr:hypothetical protein [Azohydromonas lata]MDZ5454958.1 hypothetical protein [Azohydromonas lata]